MKRKTFKRALAFFIGGIMAFSLAACGDSADKDEEITQETTQESEEETIGLVINDEDADPAGNDVSLVPVSAGSNGNGSTAPIFKPGAELMPGEEMQPGEEPEPGATPKPGAAPESNTSPKPSTSPKPGTASEPNTSPKPSVGTQATHVHSFQGGNCSTPATCSCGATGDYGSHNWVTNTTHHDATGHYEYQKIGTEQVVIGYTPKHEETYCQDCGGLIGVDIDKSASLWFLKTGHHCDGSSSGLKMYSFTTGGDPIYETQDKWGDVWVQDSAAWDEKVTKCSICGTRQ